MSLLRLAAKRDSAEPGIVHVLQVHGAVVKQLSMKNWPDLLVGYWRKWALVEVKTGHRKRTDQSGQEANIRHLRDLGLPVYYARNPDEAIAVLKEMRGEP